MAPVVVAGLLGAAWLLVRAVRIRRDPDVDSTGTGPAVAALVALVLVGWLAVDHLMVTSGRLADTLQRVYTVSDPDARGPLGLLAAAELELDHGLMMTQEDGQRSDDVELTSFEVTDRFLGVPVGRTCLVERTARVDGADSISYSVRSGGC